MIMIPRKKDNNYCFKSQFYQQKQKKSDLIITDAKVDDHLRVKNVIIVKL